MAKNITHPNVLTIAGSDSSGGAGIQADIKTISATGCYAASVITALTAQNTQGVQAVHTIPTNFIEEQLDSVFNDITFDAVKIGMLFDINIMDVIANSLLKFNPGYVVLDPVMFSKSNCELLKSDAIGYLKKYLFPICKLITPNINEAERLLGTVICNELDMELAATKLGVKYLTNVLIKGGHLDSTHSPDVLYSYNDAKCYWFTAERIHTLNTHGTGCTLSAAIASYLAQDYSLNDAIATAKNYLTDAIRFGSELQIGKGFGPVDHFFSLH